MKKIKKLLILSQIILIFQFCFISQNNAYASSFSKGECVMEVSTGRVLFSDNSAVKLPLASTTKILTCITVIDNFSLDKIITVPKEATNIEGSSIYLRENEHLSVLELLYGLMLRSGNDCAECLARTLTSYDNFISLMNKTAKKVGATNSNFVNPHGLHDDNHYTTASDLCKISCYAIKNPIFKEIVSTKKISISNEGYAYKRLLVNKNKMLNLYDGATGIKTGYTKKAGRCLVTSSYKNGMELVSVVLNSPSMWERSQTLLDNAYLEYEMCNIIDKSDYTDKVYTDKSGKKFLVELNNSFSYPLTKEEKNQIKVTINSKDCKKFFENPTSFGVFEIFLKNKLLFSQNIFTILDR